MFTLLPWRLPGAIQAPSLVYFGDWSCLLCLLGAFQAPSKPPVLFTLGLGPGYFASLAPSTRRPSPWSCLLWGLVLFAWPPWRLPGAVQVPRSCLLRGLVLFTLPPWRLPGAVQAPAPVYFGAWSCLLCSPGEFQAPSKHLVRCTLWRG